MNPSRVGVVLIGRNEGDRLRRCLASIAGFGFPAVYVDSGSSDSSVELARSMGADVVCLDLSTPFTAGRARNEGFARLIEISPDLELVQFVDGDCEMVEQWVDEAIGFLDAHEKVAIVCGRRKERFPEVSVYNSLCDLEWDTPVGYAESCGGDFIVRVKAFESASGFNDSLIAGEEPEMCYRMRRDGWQIYRLDSLMTLHDADMKTFRQWTRRSSRSGYAYAARAFLHLGDMKGYCLREIARIGFWALVLPLATIVLTILVSPWLLLLLLLYPLQYLRIYRGQKQRQPARAARAYALFALLSKWTEFYGIAVFLQRVAFRKRQEIIEYK